MLSRGVMENPSQGQTWRVQMESFSKTGPTMLVVTLSLHAEGTKSKETLQDLFRSIDSSTVLRLHFENVSVPSSGAHQ
jgi:hypothetical protein